jgi:hypothetical protein
VRVLQLAAVDRTAARDPVLAAAGQLTLRLANIPSDDMPSGALRRLGASLSTAQHEMWLRLGAGAQCRAIR